MVIEFILTIFAVFGTLTIVAYLRQLEDGMAELQDHMNVPVCPVCHIPHNNDNNKSMKRGIKRIKVYYNRKRKAAFGYCKRTK